ncbi:3-oxoacid CoA-transferase subunit B [Sporosarcina sp. GW1-11]|uniref:3-oxoacid CoA-transferase subunit B n=1 Tax=Sporosarcina sp. GW1-11 TaxID=2899126 RepID=UPI00294CCA1E|nr:3-oxoacid CoA-transferase subunit B [Sporosarcina sp. GW1-11]MDV6377460.1 3-oxoacid CoA-transferase subunit B [Sporosarcina sp. GW1-11]
MNVKQIIASTVAKHLNEGEIVNLGIGIPTLVTEYLPDDSSIYIHSENGILGVASVPEDQEPDFDLVNAGKIPVGINEGASFFDSADSFAMIRGGHVDVAVIGALEVDRKGRIANWSVPGKNVLGVGGAMDLVEGVGRVIIATTHTTKDGLPKIVEQANYPLTSQRSVDLIITELATFRVKEHQLILSELADGVTIKEVKRKTAAKFTIDLTESSKEISVS